jgi:hypothetical protein
MVPISELISKHPKLVSKLRRYSLPHAAQLVGGLGVLPELFENTIRIEILAHLVAACCSGEAKPNAANVAEWIGKLMADSPFASAEDPAEDFFVGCVNSEFGTHRIFQGVFTDGAYLVERLLIFFAEKSTFPTFQETIDGVLALLKLSDALAERGGLTRYSAGGGSASDRIRLPRWRELGPRVASVFFSEDDLQLLGIPKGVLAEFVLSATHRADLLKESMWSSSLERRPLLETANGVIILQPSTLARAAVRFMTERMLIMGGWGETFYQQANASIFVNTVRMRLNVDSLHFSADGAAPGTPFTFPAFGTFDVGKPVIMLTYTPPLAPAVNDFGGRDQLTQDEELRLDQFIQSCAAKLERIPGFSGGLVLICMGTYGRGYKMQVDHWSPNWRVYLAPLRDWVSLTADGECTAMRLWKLGDHKAACELYSVEVLNPAGLPNLVAFWKRSDFRLIPRQMDIHKPRKMLAPGCEFAQSVRVTNLQRRDEHCILAHDRGRWVRVVRHTSRALFPEDEELPIYGALADAAINQLTGCTKRGHATWWVVAPEAPDRPELRDLLYQLWDCVLSWTDRIVPIAERELATITHGSVEVRLELPDLRRWQHGTRDTAISTYAEISFGSDRARDRIDLTIPEGFVRYFNQPKNVAERRIVGALLDGAAVLANTELAATRRDELVREITRNEDARYFHVVETHEIEQLLGHSRRARPLFIRNEDTALAKLALADVAGHPQRGRITGRDQCRKVLENAVEKIWERIEHHLALFSRLSVVAACFKAIDEIHRDESHWDLTTRSLLALHDSERETKRVVRNRRSDRAAASLSNRLLIETAQYACAGANGILFNKADHLRLLAEMLLLLTLAQHRDAIALGFMDPHITVQPNGEIDVDEAFYAKVLSKYLSHRSDAITQRAAESYDAHFQSTGASDTEETPVAIDKLTALNEGFEPEFGFNVQKLIDLIDLWRDFALQSNTAGGFLAEHEIRPLLTDGCGFSSSAVDVFLDRFTLPIRSAWDHDLPARCTRQDVFPWRFRRHLSVLMRPLVQVAVSPRTWFVSASMFEKSVSYILDNLERGVLPSRFFASPQTRSFLGRIVNRKGHVFAKRVYDTFEINGFAGRLEIEMTELGAPATEGLGDIDVLAWDGASRLVYAVECKRLLTALTAREVIQRLEDFRGDKKAKDSLARHLRRIDWLKSHSEPLSKLTGIPVRGMRLTSLLVTSEVVPMQFYADMQFPTDQVIPFDDLPAYLQSQAGGT